MQTQRINLVLLLILFGCFPIGLLAEAQWITAPGLDGKAPVVLHFRRSFPIHQKPSSLPIEVSADNRFVLYVNARRVAEGPARGDLRHWRFERVDIAPFLVEGDNVIAAEVWNAVTPGSNILTWTAPLAQISDRTGFWLSADSNAAQLDSGREWRVSVQPGHTFSSAIPSLIKQVGFTFYAAGGQERIDGNQTDWDWLGAKESNASWNDAVPALAPDEASPWTLMDDPLPQMEYRPVEAGKVVRSDLDGSDGFPAKPITIPAHRSVHLLLDRGTMVSAYPHVVTSGGSGSQIAVTYAEALYDSQRKKGDRNMVGDRKAFGITDSFLPDGGNKRIFSPLWWRTWRYMQLTITTADQPLTIDGLEVDETGYPFEERGSFSSNDAQLDELWKIGWRTQRIDSHETFMDSAYWEQLQYTGDARIQMLTVYAVSGDPRLAVEAIDAIGESQREDGLTEAAYPSRTHNLIPPFSLLWIDMMHDYWMQQPDVSVLKRNLMGARKVLAWYARYTAANGLLKRTPEWSFIDWVGDPPLARDKFPSIDPVTGTSCMTSLLYLGALKDDAELEASLGDLSYASEARRQAAAIAEAVQRGCWDETRGLYADSPSRTTFSQHTNALAVLYDVAPAEKAKEILQKITLPTGIEAPADILETSYYFSWYLIRAYAHAGLADHYLDMLTTWRNLMQLHFTTWPEERGATRSDTHAWSDHPTADLLGLVAGIQPAEPGYARVLISPHPGGLTHFRGTAATPAGMVTVSYKKRKNALIFNVELPENLAGNFVWRGTSHAVHSGHNHFKVH